ncbi:Hypothetical predicted protein [Octopus vulgaris]|uniref:Uncharacterized protein n=1 Tax=Octopus vulgaris TaxID=6645 RepID=A0AA36FI52_OCTVU|nr:Hypothetical predicted protein [Octopus vulgaris]
MHSILCKCTLPYSEANPNLTMQYRLGYSYTVRADIKVAEYIITKEKKLDETIHDIRQSEKEIKEDDGDSYVAVDERVPEPPTPAEMKHYLTRLESSLES